MSKKKPVTDNDNMNRLNRITPTTNFLFNLMFLILALVCFLPIIFIFIISITKNEVLRTEGYKLFVTAETVSLDAYTFLWGQKHIILNALVISVKVTAIGTVLGVLIIGLMNNILILLGVDAFLTNAFKGAIVLLAVLMQRKEKAA